MKWRQLDHIQIIWTSPQTDNIDIQIFLQAWCSSWCQKTALKHWRQLLHADLHWFDVPEHIKFKLCTMMCQCQDSTTPQYLVVHWSPVSETASRQHLRSAASYQLTVPPHRRTTYGGRAFAVAGLSMWNSLPKRLRDPSSSSAVIGRLLKTFPLLKVLVYLAY